MDKDVWTEERQWQMVSLGSAIVAAVLVRGAIRAGWRLTRNDTPPLNPLRQDGTWMDAVLFSVATGLTVGLARLGARAIATRAWEDRHLPSLPFRG